ncbi:MAG: hypothetical protein SZ59_C0004G0092 [candidate division TM6 bacterium GW2011_GWF2_28_16]|nr:MAG: hypothetical protein SZ59_C0004G0092 [candidate division TM6 bacterium GW2011_GWF2_28_16]
MKKFVIFLILIFFNNLNAINYPNSTTETDRITNVLTVLQGLNAGDTVSTAVQGLCWFKAGLSVDGASAGRVNFSCPIPVDREIYLNEDVVLDLHKDLVFSGSVRLARSGNIIAGSATRLESSIILTGPFDLGSKTLTCTYGPMFINGNGNVIDFRKGGRIFYDSRNTNDAGRTAATIRNCELRGVKFETEADSRLWLRNYSAFNWDNVLLRLDGDYLIPNIDYKHLNIIGDVLVTGTYMFKMDGTCNVSYNSLFCFDVGTTFSIGRTAVFTSDGSGRAGFYFNGCNINISAKDFLIDNATLIFSNEVRITDENWNRKFIIGSNCNVILLAGARILLDGTTTLSLL